MLVMLKIEGFFPIKVNEQIQAYGRQDLNNKNMYEIKQISIISNNINYESTAINERNIEIIGDVNKCIITDKGYRPGMFFTYISIQNEQI